MADFATLEKSLGFTFSDKELLARAFTHRSFLNEHRGEKLEPNERLEFLGDSVLNYCVSQYLFTTYPENPEGDLTNFRASIVKTEFLSGIARELNLNSYILMSKGEEDSGGRERETILADTVEAFLGGIFLDQGIEACLRFVTTYIVPHLGPIIEKRSYRDYKSRLQEHTQIEKDGTPSYRVLSTEGPDHDRIFQVGVYVHNKLMGKGSGKNKQQAEQEAAQNALAKLKIL